MPGPVLSADEIEQLQKEKAKAEAAAATFAGQVAAQQARAAELAKTDSAFKKFFDYYDDIIKAYDAELKAINGTYIISPVVEQDIIDCASLAGGRIQPSLPTTDVVRISEFDGGGTAVNPLNEIQHLTDQIPCEDHLKTGWGGGAYAATILTDTDLTPSSTTMKLKDTATTFTVSVGSVIVVSTMSDLAVIKVNGFVMQTSPVPPPYIANLDIEYIVPPTGTIVSGQTIASFNGFTDAERIAKTPTDPKLQPLMDYLIDELAIPINARIARLDEQLAALATNQDPDAVAEIASTISVINTHRANLVTYLATMDVSNFGLTGLAIGRSNRASNIIARQTQIATGYTGRTENYYNRRYSCANDRANTSRGTLRLQKAAEQNATQSSAFASSLTDQATAMGNILP